MPQLLLGASSFQAQQQRANRTPLLLPPAHLRHILQPEAKLLPVNLGPVSDRAAARGRMEACV